MVAQAGRVGACWREWRAPRWQAWCTRSELGGFLLCDFEPDSVGRTASVAVGETAVDEEEVLSRNHRHEGGDDRSLDARRVIDLAGRDHWEAVWKGQWPARVCLLNYYHFRLDRIFSQWLTPGMRVLEVGCGGSRWLGHLVRMYCCEGWGIDYSATGVALVRRNLAALDVADRTRILEGDLFEQALLPVGCFDVVYSMGFIEHFREPGRAVGRMAELLKPGGLALQLVPNLEGFVGWLHKVVDTEIFHKHIVVAPRELDRMHEGEGFIIEAPAVYVGVFSLSVVNYSRLRRRLPLPVDMGLWMGVQAFQQLVCLGPRIMGLTPESRWFSPWIVGVYRRGS